MPTISLATANAGMIVTEPIKVKDEVVLAASTILTPVLMTLLRSLHISEITVQDTDAIPDLSNAEGVSSDDIQMMVQELNDRFIHFDNHIPIAVELKRELLNRKLTQLKKGT